MGYFVLLDVRRWDALSYVMFNDETFSDIDGNVTAKKLYTWEQFKIGYS